MHKDNNTFSTLSAMVEHFSKLPGVVGIMEYGNRTHDNMTIGGDYDMTVIFDKPISQNFNGVHFHINRIPVDCVLSCVDDFTAPNPPTSFFIAHTNAKILYDKDGITKGLHEGIKTRWKLPHNVSESTIMFIRFLTRHALDKLDHRLYDDEIYSHHLISSTADFILDMYAEVNCLEKGRPKHHLAQMSQHDPTLYNHYSALYSTTDLSLKFETITKISAYFADKFGGMWREDEVLFHLKDGGTFNENEQLSFIKFLFN